MCCGWVGLTTICATRRGNLKGQFFKLTPAVLTIAMADIYLNYSRAKRDFGYEPPYTMEEAFEQCSHYYQPELTSQKPKTQQ
jgi:nucleoside-diphosphate-sugar epimerase